MQIPVRSGSYPEGAFRSGVRESAAVSGERRTREYSRNDEVARTREYEAENDFRKIKINVVKSDNTSLLFSWLSIFI